MKIAIQLSVSMALLFSVPTDSQAAIVADSVAEFSDVQGTDNWYYGYYDGDLSPETFKLMPVYGDMSLGVWNFATDVWFVQAGPGGYWTNLAANFSVSNGTNGNHGRLPEEQWSVRRWISEVSGEIDISVDIAALQGGRMFADIIVDGDSVFRQQAPPYPTVTSYDVTTTVENGSTVDFVVSPNNHYDVDGTTMFTAVIDAVPEPCSLTLAIFALPLLLFRRRK